MTYDEALAVLNGMEGRAWRLGLDRMRALVDRAGLESALTERGYIHVAGTNGKGTTTAFVESVLRHQGWRTGAYFSPYVVDYRERIQADGRLIEREDLVRLVERLLPIANSLSDSELGGASKFELEAAMGLAYWEQKACDWVALEVGLGGRLDATNVVTPRACVVVSIGLDHTSILGNTVEEIATEKAGIIKPGLPVVLGEMSPEALSVLERIATEREAPVWRIGREVVYSKAPEGWSVDTPGARFIGLRPTLGGERTPHNMALAIAACAAAGALADVRSVPQAVEAAWLPGRWEVRHIEGREVILDGAHNGDAAEALARSLAGRRVRLVTNMLAGHEVEAFYRMLASHAVAAEVAPIDSPRALTVESAVQRIAAIGVRARGHASVRDALDSALREDDGTTTLVTGSNYLVGEALRLLG